MRKYIYTLITLLLIPMLVNAETLTYNICKSGCEYSSLEEIKNHFNELYSQVGEEVLSTYDVIINFKDSETYEENYFVYYLVNSLTINGNNAKIISKGFAIHFIHNATINNINITTEVAQLVGVLDWQQIEKPNYSEYKNYIFNINNCIIKATNKPSLLLAGGIFNFSNSSLNISELMSVLGDTYIKNTFLSPSLLFIGGSGDVLYDSNTYLDLNDLEKNKKIVRTLYTEENIDALLTKYPQLNETNFLLDEYILVEVPLTEEYINNGITKTNNIFIKQEVSKTIKTNTNISEFESEFINTYEDSIGYDDIKDLPIEWKSENASVAKIENGVIIPISVGSVDLVGTRGNDIYTIHLTVEKETIPEKIDKMTIKVPITGSKIKVWVVFISVILLGLTLVCSYILVKRRK